MNVKPSNSAVASKQLHAIARVALSMPIPEFAIVTIIEPPSCHGILWVILLRKRGVFGDSDYDLIRLDSGIGYKRTAFFLAHGLSLLSM
jgi:hypothetical protein